MKTYQITKSLNGYFLYPTPVIKGEKFLIYAANENYAEVLKKCLNDGFLEFPFKEKSMHGDGQTPILELDEEKFYLNLLTARHTIEKVLSQKVLALMKSKTADDRTNAKKELEHRYQTQIKCSECQKLGIASITLQNWLKDL